MKSQRCVKTLQEILCSCMVKGISQNQMPDVTENGFCFSRSQETDAAKTQTDCSQRPDMHDFTALMRPWEMNHSAL